jgi:hypothetical protein
MFNIITLFILSSIKILCVLGEIIGKNFAATDYYILYLPKSSGFRFSSHFLISSGELLSADNAVDTLLDDLEITSSVTKMGESIRKAKAIASDGRESTVIIFPSTFRKIKA